VIFGAGLSLTDTHCHLDFQLFDEDRNQVVSRAREAGVTHILNPGIDLASSQAALELAEKYAEVYVAVGVHPNSAGTFDQNTLPQLRDLVSHPKVVAIGEIGLDYYRDRAPRELQQRIFRLQLELAAESGLPVVIHNRQATADVLEGLTEWQAQLLRTGSALANRPGVLHSYSDNEENGRKAIEINFYIGITGPVTFRNAPDLQQVVASLPIEHLLIETDAPFLAPHPLRGQRNEPALVRRVAEKIAELHSRPVDEVARVTSENAGRLFNWRVMD
jgi:TatD DNase family protein